MAWIESHQDLATNAKTRRAARLLDVPVPQIIGHLHMMWWWALDHAFDGDLSDFDAIDLADAAGWDGDPDRFVEALVECGPGSKAGFLDADLGRLSIHDWREHTAPMRAKREASQKAHHTRWHAQRGQIDPDCTWCARQDDAAVTDDSGPSDVPADAEPDQPKCEPDAVALPTHADRNAPEPGPEPDPLAPAGAKDGLTAAISTAAGQRGIPPPGTRARDQLDLATLDIAKHGATPHDVPQRAREYRRRWPNVALTPLALAKHWPDLAPQPTRRPEAAVYDPTPALIAAGLQEPT